MMVDLITYNNELDVYRSRVRLRVSQNSSKREGEIRRHVIQLENGSLLP